MYCTLYIIQCAVYILYAHCTLYLCIVHCTCARYICIVHFTLYSVQCILYIVHVNCTLYSVHYSLSSQQYGVHKVMHYQHYHYIRNLLPALYSTLTHTMTTRNTLEVTYNYVSIFITESNICQNQYRSLKHANMLCNRLSIIHT